MKLLVAVAAFGVLLFTPIIALVLVAQLLFGVAHLTLLSPEPSDEALDDIPPHLLNVYLDAGQECGTIPWNVLAAVGKVEHDHGRIGEFTFTPPVPGNRDTLPHDPTQDDGPFEYYADDGVVAPEEYRAIVDQLAGFLCAAVPDVPLPIAGADQVVTVPTNAVTHEVTTAEDWDAALAVVQPGEVIRLTANISSPLTYRGPSGTPDTPIWITADPGVWIDPGSIARGSVGVRVIEAAHVNVVGVRVRHTHFGIWIQGSTGTPGSPLVVANNTIEDVGQAGLIVSDNTTRTVPSSFVQVIGNTITRTGRLDPQYGEGIYIGSGTPGWVDHTNNIEVLGNDISETTGDGIDIKPGTTDLLIEGNSIHDNATRDGGAITAHWAGSPNPDPSVNGNLVIRGNAIWNHNLAANPEASDAAVWIGHGGVTFDHNVIWSLRDTDTAMGVRVQARAPFGPHPVTITNNLFWTTTGVNPFGDHTPAQLIVAGNKGPAGATGIEEALPTRPGIPAFGEPSRADTGGGPGSAFGFDPHYSGGGYAQAEATGLLPTALAAYNDDGEWVDAVLEQADAYAFLPAVGDPGIPPRARPRRLPHRAQSPNPRPSRWLATGSTPASPTTSPRSWTEPRPRASTFPVGGGGETTPGSTNSAESTAAPTDGSTPPPNHWPRRPPPVGSRPPQPGTRCTNADSLSTSAVPGGHSTPGPKRVSDGSKPTPPPTGSSTSHPNPGTGQPTAASHPTTPRGEQTP